MKRRAHLWWLLDGDTALASGSTYAVNSAMAAGVAAVRAIARQEGQLYARDRANPRAWIGERTGRRLIVALGSTNGLDQ